MFAEKSKENDITQITREGYNRKNNVAKNLNSNQKLLVSQQE